MASSMDPDPLQVSELECRRHALAETRVRIAAMEALLEQLPALFETRFRERLEPLLMQQQQLLSDNALLRQQLRALGSPVEPELIRLKPDASDHGPPTDASAGPTHR